MLYISDTSTDPFFNLAEEEYLLTQKTDSVFRLWRNAPSIIVGRYQNTIAEINTEYTQEHNIPVVRRLSGGGAVFHDLGNLNFSFIQNRACSEGGNALRKQAADTSEMFRRFTAPIIDALRSLGVNAELQGRNDISIDGKKISGNAICIHRDRILMHGTLMFDVSTTDLSRALRPRPEKFIGKAVKSNVKRVTNIKEHLTPEGILQNPIASASLKNSTPNILWFTRFLSDYICSHIEGVTPYSLTTEDIRCIEELKKSRYSTPEWNFGNSPKYSFSNIRRFPSGIVELYMNVENGTIKNLDIRGDYFFSRPTEELIAKLIGTPHTREAIQKKIGSQTEAYFAGIDSEDVVNLFF